MRGKFLDVRDEKVPDEDGCPSRNMTIKAYDLIAAGLPNGRYVTLHVRLMPETKDSINEVWPMRFLVCEHFCVTSPLRPRVPKRATVINAPRPDRVRGGRDGCLRILSVSTPT